MHGGYHIEFHRRLFFKRGGEDRIDPQKVTSPTIGRLSIASAPQLNLEHTRCTFFKD